MDFCCIWFKFCWQQKIKSFHFKYSLLCPFFCLLHSAAQGGHTLPPFWQMCRSSIHSATFKFKFFFFSFPVAQQPNSGLGHLIIEASKSHTVRHTHTPGRTPLEEWAARHRGSTCTTHNKRKRQNIHAFNRIRTHDPSNQAAADLRLRPRCRRDQPSSISVRQKILQYTAMAWLTFSLLRVTSLLDGRPKVLTKANNDCCIYLVLQFCLLAHCD
jgi:hypothetical protein